MLPCEWHFEMFRMYLIASVELITGKISTKNSRQISAFDIIHSQCLADPNMTGKITLLRNPPHKRRTGILGLWTLVDGFKGYNRY